MGSKSFTNNNPGNIVAYYGKDKNGKPRVSRWVKGLPGYLGYDKAGFAIFEYPCDGLAAMVRLLTGSKYKHLTISQAIKQYSETDQEAYISYVCEKSELSPMKIIRELDPFELLRMVGFMMRFEGWKP